MKVFSMFLEGEHRGNLCHILIIQFMYIPMLIKNTGLAIFNVSLYKVLLTTIPSIIFFSIP